MGIADRFATKLLEKAEQKVVSAAASAKEAVATVRSEGGGSGFMALLRMDNDAALSIEALTVIVAGAVRKDDETRELTDKNVFKAARRRYFRLGAAATPFGPVGGYLVNLYCEAATLCDIVELRGAPMSDDEVAAHLLVIWHGMPDVAAARAAIDGSGPSAVASLSARAKAGTRAQLPSLMTKKSAITSLWRLRGAVGDVLEDAAPGVRGRLFPGKRVKQFIKQVHAQLGTAGEPAALPSASGALGSGRRLHSSRPVADCRVLLEELARDYAGPQPAHLPASVEAGWRWTAPVEPAPQTAVCFDDDNGDFLLAALWPVDGGTDAGLFPLGEGDDRLQTLPVIGDWKQRDPSLTPTGVIAAGHVALAPPHVPEDYAATTLSATGLAATAEHLTRVSDRLAELLLLKAAEQLAPAGADAADRFKAVHPYAGGPLAPFCQAVLNDIVALDPALLPDVQDLPARVRAAFLDDVPGAGVALDR